ncbi:hypothetical protein C8R48DRAFT_677619 [Suillus tomentosus]|nr:hypothetical protein C8R48DRAFT_677619 [Suillus tomentosus]
MHYSSRLLQISVMMIRHSTVEQLFSAKRAIMNPRKSCKVVRRELGLVTASFSSQAVRQQHSRAANSVVIERPQTSKASIPSLLHPPSSLSLLVSFLVLCARNRRNCNLRCIRATGSTKKQAGETLASQRAFVVSVVRARVGRAAVSRCAVDTAMVRFIIHLADAPVEHPAFHPMFQLFGFLTVQCMCSKT